MRRQGVKFETRILEYQRQHVPPDPVPERLRLPSDTAVGFLALLRLVDDRIICLDRRYLPPDVARRFDPQMITDRAVAEVLQDLVGQSIASADWTTEIVAAPREVALPLGVTPGSGPENLGTEYLPGGRPIQVHTMCYRIDRVRFQFAVNYSAAGSETQAAGRLRRGLGDSALRVHRECQRHEGSTRCRLKAHDFNVLLGPGRDRWICRDVPVSSRLLQPGRHVDRGC